MNSNAVISCCWTLGSTTEDPLLLSLLFLIKSKEVKVFPTKIRHFTTRTFPEIFQAVGSVNSRPSAQSFWHCYEQILCCTAVETGWKSRKPSPSVLCLQKASFISRTEGNRHPMLLAIKWIQENKGNCGQLLWEKEVHLIINATKKVTRKLVFGI